MSNLSRKSFLSALASTYAAVACGSAINDGFEDIVDDKYYELQGGPYKDTGGIGSPGASWRHDLIKLMRTEEYSGNMDNFIGYVERKGFYFNVSLYFPHTTAEWEAYGHRKILLTKDWLKEFYRRHC